MNDIQAGDEPFEAFCRREYPRLVGALSLYCGDVFVAEELAQEALVRVYESWPKVSAMTAPGGWAHRVAINLANSHARRRKAERRARSRRGDPPEGCDDADAVIVVSVRQALAALPARQRAAVVLRHFLDLSSQDMAVVMGVSAEAARALVARGLVALRGQLGDEVDVRDSEVIGDAR